MNDEFSDILGFGAVLLLAAAVIMGTIALPIILLERGSCYSKARAMRLEASFGPLQGCLVQAQEGSTTGWLPLDTYLSRTVPQKVEVK